VVYPKDIGPILHWGDIGRAAGCSRRAPVGALTMALVQAVGPRARWSASRSARTTRPERAPRSSASRRDPAEPDPSPGESGGLGRGGGPGPAGARPPGALAGSGARRGRDGRRRVLTTYLPTVPQVQHLHDELRRSRRFLTCPASRCSCGLGGRGPFGPPGQPDGGTHRFHHHGRKVGALGREEETQ